MDASYYVGIDLGTTNSVVAVMKKGFQPEIAEVNNQPLLRSVVRYKDDGTTIIGKACLQPGPVMKGNVITNFKRVIGRKMNDKFVNKVKGSCRAEVVDDGHGMVAFSVPNAHGLVTPEMVAARLLDELYEAALNKTADGTVESVIVTVPASYNNEQRLAMKRAIDLSQVGSVKNVKLVDEPSAAAVSYGIGENYKNCNIMVYDLGGGTFDVSIIKVLDRDEFRVLATDGDIQIGGEAFDDAILQDLRDFIRNTEDEVDPLERIENKEMDVSEEDYPLLRYRAFSLLRDKCREAKEFLSAPNYVETPIELDDYYERIAKEFPRPKMGNDVDDYDALDPVNDEYVLTREKLERLIKGDIAKTLDITERCLEKANLTKDCISVVVMVGGSSSIPYVRKAVKKVFGEDRVRDIEPSECVAKGASMLASMKVHNITTRDLCIAASGYQYNVVIPRNTEYPTSGKKIFHTGRYNVGRIDCSAYEYDTEYHLIDNLVIDDESLEGGAPVEFQYNVTDEGICYLTVRNVDEDSVLLENKPLSLSYGVQFRVC